MSRSARAHVIVSGRVQGVGFRYSCADMARASGVAGWVHNRPDGALEAVFEGTTEQVDAAVAWTRTGPRGAAVASVDVRAETPEGLNGFEIR